MKGWTLQKHVRYAVTHPAQQQARGLPQRPSKLSEREPVFAGRAAWLRYLRLLLDALLLEVLGVLTSGHSLKFRSNTLRKGSLLINN